MFVFKARARQSERRARAVCAADGRLFSAANLGNHWRGAAFGEILKYAKFEDSNFMPFSYVECPDC